MIKRIFSVLGILLMMAAFYLVSIVANQEEDSLNSFIVEGVSEPLKSVGTLLFNSADQMKNAFGAQIPSSGSAGQGKVYDAEYFGGAAILAEWKDGTATIRCVRPAAAAGLLLQSGTVLSPNVSTALGLPAVYANGGGMRCVYFAGDDAAYAVCAQVPDDASFAAYLATLSMR